eukprot:6248442-Amphidinium_carterae.1
MDARSEVALDDLMEMYEALVSGGAGVFRRSIFIGCWVSDKYNPGATPGYRIQRSSMIHHHHHHHHDHHQCCRPPMACNIGTYLCITIHPQGLANKSEHGSIMRNRQSEGRC